MGLPGQSLRLPEAQMAKCHHTIWSWLLWLLPTPLLGQANPSGELAVWGFANFDSPRRVPKQDSQVLLDRAGRDGSRVRAPLPCEAANLNWVHECQQVPWRAEGRGDIGAAGGSIYSCFLKNPV